LLGKIGIYIGSRATFRILVNHTSSTGISNADRTKVRKVFIFCRTLGPNSLSDSDLSSHFTNSYFQPTQI